jgi:RHS repeat-associated protein
MKFLLVIIVIVSAFGAVDTASAFEYLHQNHQGSTVAVSNEEGEVVEQIQYEPFGQAVGETELSYTYTDQESDATDLMYYGARYQDPNIEQFTQPDQIDTFALTSDPQSLNPYSYTRNNPVNMVDPSGNIDIRSIAKWFIGVGDSIFGIDETSEIPKNGFKVQQAYNPGTVNYIEEAEHPNAFGLAMREMASSAGLQGSLSDDDSNVDGVVSISVGMNPGFGFVGGKAGSVISTDIEIKELMRMIKETKTAPKVVHESGLEYLINILRHGENSLISRLHNSPVVMPKGRMSVKTMADITSETGREVGLFRLNTGDRVLVMGRSLYVDPPKGAIRLVAHTHPSSVFNPEKPIVLKPSSNDIAYLKSLNQKSSLLISPDGRTLRFWASQ